MKFLNEETFLSKARRRSFRDNQLMVCCASITLGKKAIRVFALFIVVSSFKIQFLNHVDAIYIRMMMIKKILIFCTDDVKITSKWRHFTVLTYYHKIRIMFSTIAFYWWSAYLHYASVNLSKLLVNKPLETLNMASKIAD